MMSRVGEQQCSQCSRWVTQTNSIDLRSIQVDWRLIAASRSSVVLNSIPRHAFYLYSSMEWNSFLRPREYKYYKKLSSFGLLRCHEEAVIIVSVAGFWCGVLESLSSARQNIWFSLLVGNQILLVNVITDDNKGIGDAFTFIRYNDLVKESSDFRSAIATAFDSSLIRLAKRRRNEEGKGWGQQWREEK